jgi:hypothetical protein
MWIILLLGLILGVPLLCCGGCIGFGYWGLGMAGQQIAAEIKDHPAVQQHLGDNLTLTANFTATAQEQQKRGSDKWMAFDAKGSKGSGTVIVETPQQPGGAQGFQSVFLRTSTGEEVQVK